MATTEEVKAKKAPKNTPKLENQGGLELVMLRSNFYRDNYRKLMIVCLLLLLIIACLLGAIYYQEINKPQPKYFATTSDGRLIEIPALSEPYKTRAELSQWVTEAVTTVNNFDFVNYRRDIQSYRRYFTARGHQEYLKALSDSNNLNAVRERKMVVSAAATRAPEILQEGTTSTNRHIWLVRIPITLTFESANEQIRQEQTVDMRIIRVPTLENPQGVGIATYVARQGGAV